MELGVFFVFIYFEIEVVVGMDIGEDFFWGMEVGIIVEGLE